MSLANTLFIYEASRKSTPLERFFKSCTYLHKYCNALVAYECNLSNTLQLREVGAKLCASSRSTGKLKSSRSRDKKKSSVNHSCELRELISDYCNYDDLIDVLHRTLNFVICADRIDRIASCAG